jgi:hypothetical protein
MMFHNMTEILDCEGVFTYDGRKVPSYKMNMRRPDQNRESLGVEVAPQEA